MSTGLGQNTLTGHGTRGDQQVRGRAPGTTHHLDTPRTPQALQREPKITRARSRTQTSPKGEGAQADASRKDVQDLRLDPPDPNLPPNLNHRRPHAANARPFSVYEKWKPCIFVLIYCTIEITFLDAEETANRGRLPQTFFHEKCISTRRTPCPQAMDPSK